MKFMLDTKEFKEKPKYGDGGVTRRIYKYPVDMSIKEFKREIVKGKSFTPCLLSKDANVRSSKFWESQEFLCLDFDNEIKKDGKKVRHITMTLEQALNEFKNDATFIYKSFSYKDDHPKFRVVLVFDRVIEDPNEIDTVFDYYRNKYPDCDTSCLDKSRLFFGGKEIVDVDENNKINVDMIINKHKNNYVGNSGVANSIKVIKSNSICDTQNPPIHINHIFNKQYNINNTIYIHNKDINKLQELLYPNDILFHTHEEVYDYLNKQDLARFLGVSGKKFKCLFHEDKDPSANIIVLDNGHHIYKCFSEHCTFKTGTIVKCVERILKCNRVKALRFLRKVYKINYHETEWQKEQKEILDENLRYLKNESFKYDNQDSYSLVKRYLSDLYILNSIAKDNLPAEHYDDSKVDILFFTSLRQYAELSNQKSPRRLGDRLALFAYLGFVMKLSEDQIPDKLLKEAKSELVKNKNKYGIEGMKLNTFLGINSYSDELMTEVNKKAVEFKEKGFTMKGWSREMIYRALGEEEADRVYPQLKGKKLTETSKELTGKIEKIVMSFVEDKGWVTEREILEQLYDELYGEGVGKEFQKKQLKRIIGEMIDKYDLKRIRLNKKIKEEYDIDIKGYPFGYMKNE